MTDIPPSYDDIINDIPESVRNDPCNEKQTRMLYNAIHLAKIYGEQFLNLNIYWLNDVRVANKRIFYQSYSDTTESLPQKVKSTYYQHGENIHDIIKSYFRQKIYNYRFHVDEKILKLEQEQKKN